MEKLQTNETETTLETTITEASRPVGVETEISSADTSVSETETTTATETTTFSTTTTPATTTEATTVQTTTAPTVTTIPETAVTETTATTIAPTEDYLFYVADYGVTQDTLIYSLLVIAFIIFIFRVLKKRKKKVDTDSVPKNARERDARRISEIKQKKEKPKKKKLKGKKLDLFAFLKPKHVLDRLPYKKILHGDIWLIDTDTYSRAYVFDDINYNMYDFDEKNAVLANYCNFLNSLDDTVDCQICLFNKPMSISDLEREVLIHEEYGDGFAELRKEYNNRVLKPAITKGIHNATSTYQKLMCLTLTIHTASEEKAALKFNTLDLSVENHFKAIGNTKLRVMTSNERVEMLHDVFKAPSETPPNFTEEEFAESAEKLYIAPDYFEWKNGYFIFDDSYAAVYYDKFDGKEVVEDVLTNLLKLNLDGNGKLLVTMNLIAHDKAKAEKLIQSQITAIQTNVSQRNAKAAQHGVIQDTPKTFQDMIDDLTRLHDSVSGEGQNLFSTSFLVMVTANDYTDLLQNAEYVKDALKGKIGDIAKIKVQQYDAFCDVLPCGSHRAFNFRRSLNSAVIAVTQPFNVTEIRRRNSIYYGRNTLSGNIITFNKFSLINPSGFILGCPGSGKSFSTKREIIDVFLRYTTADVMIIDPEREYGPLVRALDGETVKFSTGSTNYINPFEFDIDLLDAVIDDEKVNVVADKSNLITGFISAMDSQNPLNSQEKSFIDRCVRKSYEPLLNKLNDWDYKTLPASNIEKIKDELMPTLGTFYEIMQNEDRINVSIKEKLLQTLEMYVDGSANYFNNATNIDVNSRIISGPSLKR
jgi:hypothetical protein